MKLKGSDRLRFCVGNLPAFAVFVIVNRTITGYFASKTGANRL